MTDNAAGAVVAGPGRDGIRQAPCGGGQQPDTTEVARRISELECEVRELRRANEILKAASAYFARELDPRLAPAAARIGLAGDMPGAASWPAGLPRRTADQSSAPTRVEFRVLGPIEAVVADREADLGAPKQRALLALLVGRISQLVPVDVILEELWAGNPPPSAITSLQAYIANLRKVLEPNRAPRTPATVLRTRGRGYLLDGRVAQVDVHQFADRARAGRQALDHGDPHDALTQFEAGLALWRGQAYAEAADAPYLKPEIARLEELRLSAIEGRCAALLAVGAHQMAAAELDAFLRAHPLREYACELHSLALYRAGRQADALAVLRANQQRLTAELGIDPRPALRNLQRDILNHAPALDWQPTPATHPDLTRWRWTHPGPPAPHTIRQTA